MNPVVTGLIYVLEAIFLAGVTGSAVVLLLITFKDVKVLFEKRKPAPGIVPDGALLQQR